MEYIYVSNIDLGECEKLLKNKEKLKEEDELLILKTDIKSDDYAIIYVQYEIYHPYNKTKLDLEICQNVSIYINTPVSLSSDIESLYESLNKSGYNLFDSNDSFYNDICTPYTSEKGIDIPMIDRQNEIFSKTNNNTMCQNNCSFLNYNSTTKKSKCDCFVQIEETITDTNLINFKKVFLDNFYKALKNSNFLVLKCFKLNFSIIGQTKNIGSYIMIAIFLLFIISIIIYFISGAKKLENIINDIIRQKRGLKTKSFEKASKQKMNSNKNKIFKTETNKKKLSKKKSFKKKKR